MIDGIIGLSGLAAGLLGPVALRAPRSVEPAGQNRAPGEARGDLFEFGPHHQHGSGEVCPYCQAAGDLEEGRGVSQSLNAAPLEEQTRETDKLERRDREVRSHEQAHKAAGGAHAGAISLEFQTGADGKRYAVGGEVPIDTSPVAGDPQATITKMQKVRRAALAPAQPSSQDRAVAAQASRIEAEARAELAEQNRAGGLDDAPAGDPSRASGGPNRGPVPSPPTPEPEPGELIDITV